MSMTSRKPSPCFVFFISLLISRILHIDSIDSKSFYLWKVLKFLLWEKIYYIICMSRSDIDGRKFCRYMWYNLFWNPSVEKDYGGVNLNKVDRRIDREIIF